MNLIANTIAFVKTELANAEGGHDWFHIERVWKLAKTIAKEEHVNTLVVELAALLHDIADSKFNNGDEEIGPSKALAFLNTQDISEADKTHVIQIIENISFKGGRVQYKIDTIEFKVCQDADRMDAIGAIGIARAFNYGGFKNRGLYDPEKKPNLNMTKEEYKKSDAPTVNHFYEKLLLLKDKMHTDTAKAMAEERHVFMENYLEQFYAEFNGTR
jgi:uncharacterized protein